ncbi:hypothetical protein Cde04nite_15320 [Cellulomonas denverensis]|nr:hypothetical protein Cde04nite_15320 [Cellulomonas denverensis]
MCAPFPAAPDAARLPDPPPAPSARGWRAAGRTGPGSRESVMDMIWGPALDAEIRYRQSVVRDTAHDVGLHWRWHHRR